MLWGRGEEMLLRKIAVVETTHTMTHVAALASGQEVATNPFWRRSKQTRCFQSKSSNARKANAFSVFGSLHEPNPERKKALP